MADIQRFIEFSTLSLLIQFPENDELKEQTVIEVTAEGCTFSDFEHSKFCSDWAQVLLSQGATNTDPFFLKQAIENFKLKIIQDINAFKRLIQKAEADYYSLYKSYLFLCVCGNGQLLIDCAINEANSLTDSSSSLSVLKVLQEYTKRNGFRSVKSMQI
ncbi:protein Njmu-R1-like [Dysidea avara]|uniref:protein Njmu-R1-like n=1 Tax=Dysidea avara TaxID=196820 RepID=UPI00332E49E9